MFYFIMCDVAIVTGPKASISAYDEFNLPFDYKSRWPVTNKWIVWWGAAIYHFPDAEIDIVIGYWIVMIYEYIFINKAICQIC